MKTLGFAVLGMVLLQACTPPVPASNAGPGFNDAADFAMERARRDADLAASGSAVFASPTPVQTGAIGANDLAAAGIGSAASAASINAPLSAMKPNLAGAPVSADTLTSESQNFDPVTGREAADAQLRAQQAANRKVFLPQKGSSGAANTGPSIVEYALNAPNRKGQEWYSRSIFASQGRFERNCLKYSSSDAAQRDFLANGGPDRDRKGIDPDGDGFACGWDPALFKQSASR